MISLEYVMGLLSNATYGALLFVAILGAYYVIVVWFRLAALRFRRERAQNEFLEAVEGATSARQFDQVLQMCEGDRRVLPRLITAAVSARNLGFAKAKQLAVDIFHRDVLADLEHRMSWINTVIKTAPMLGLFGTVTGMLQAFSELAKASESSGGIDAGKLAAAIGVALYTTADGLAIAIPLLFIMASINVRLRKLEEQVSGGLSRFMDAYKGTFPK
jgi:biopolymer transport protein ExbB